MTGPIGDLPPNVNVIRNGQIPDGYRVQYNTETNEYTFIQEEQEVETEFESMDDFFALVDENKDGEISDEEMMAAKEMFKESGINEITINGKKYNMVYADGGTTEGTGENDIIWGTQGDDKLVGKGGDDILFGGAGDDTLKGKRGKDMLIGGGGDDKLKGGFGNDNKIQDNQVFYDTQQARIDFYQERGKVETVEDMTETLNKLLSMDESQQAQVLEALKSKLDTLIKELEESNSGVAQYKQRSTTSEITNLRALIENLEGVFSGGISTTEQVNDPLTGATIDITFSTSEFNYAENLFKLLIDNQDLSRTLDSAVRRVSINNKDPFVKNLISPETKELVKNMLNASFDELAEKLRGLDIEGADKVLVALEVYNSAPSVMNEFSLTMTINKLISDNPELAEALSGLFE